MRYKYITTNKKSCHRRCLYLCGLWQKCLYQFPCRNKNLSLAHKDIGMKHIVIFDDKTKQHKAFLELAKVLNGIKIMTEAQWEAAENKFTAREIKKGLKTPAVNKEDVKKVLQKMRS